MVKTLGKATIGDLISAVRRPFAKAAPEAVEAMGKKWAAEGAEKAGESIGKGVTKEVQKNIDDIVKNIEKTLSKSNEMLSPQLRDKVLKVELGLKESVKK